MQAPDDRGRPAVPSLPRSNRPIGREAICCEPAFTNHREPDSSGSNHRATPGNALMLFELDGLLSRAECLEPRTPQDLRTWVVNKCDAFAQIPELREPVLLHKGPFKSFHEEIYPLSMFAIRHYGHRSDVHCMPTLDSTHDFDAKIQFLKPRRTIKLEITGARDPSEHLRMEYFVGHRLVGRFGDVTVEGTRRTGRKIHHDLEFVNSEEPRASHLGWIRAPAEGKAVRGRYGKGYELLISVEDFWFGAFGADDGPEVTRFIQSEILGLSLPFDAVHLVGFFGRLFLSFPLR